MSSELFSTAYSLDRVANVPYFPQAISAEVVRRVKEIEGIDCTEDHLAVYAYYHKGNPVRKIVVDTHLDHPGFVMKNDNTAVGIGSIPSPDVVGKIKDERIPVVLFSRHGDPRGKGFLTDFLEPQKAISGRLTLEEGDTGKNYQVVPDMPHAYMANEDVYMRSADNLAVSAVALEFLRWLSSEQPDADCVVIFTKLEEVRQISAVGIAQKKATPYGRFNDQTHIIVLEAATVGKTKFSQEVSNRSLDSEHGVIIRVADNELVYQKQGFENSAESLLLNIRDVGNLRAQHGPMISNCNASAYVVFESTPNVVGLTVPCLHKHNFNSAGILSHEVVKHEDLLTTLAFLKGSIVYEGNSIHPERIIRSDRQFSGNSSVSKEKKRRELLSAFAWAEPHLKKGYIYPDTLRDTAQFALGSLKSRLVR